jgi:GrpB-like predicted nucleotidyltransferase (UPF0157 family)
VPDSADEAAYVGDLEAAEYVLRIREPDWFEHRLFNAQEQDVNLHVFSVGCSETERMVRFRDWLRANAADRELHVRTKRELAVRDWKYMQQYADAKTFVVEQIMTVAEAATRPPLPLRSATAYSSSQRAPQAYRRRGRPFVQGEASL